MLTSSRRKVAPPSDSNRAGFGLVELIVAIMILTIGVLGLASTAAYVTRQVNEGGQATFAATRVSSLLDSLRSVACDRLVNGSIAASLGNKRIEQVWTVTPTGAMLRAYKIGLKVRYVTQRGNSRWQSFTMNRPCLK
jgi:prepilin-type N-terminal cleavage/methylation domain-containing protein